MLSINEKNTLDKVTEDFFPNEGKWYNICLYRPKTIEKRNLPCHLRNNKWMAKLMSAMLKEDDIEIPVKNIKYYMDHSRFFNEQRHAYELRIVKWQLEFPQNCTFYELNRLQQEEGLMYDPMSLIGGITLARIQAKSIKEPNEPSLNSKISKTKKLLSQIGINKDAINEGIEQYLSLLDDACSEK